MLFVQTGFAQSIENQQIVFEGSLTDNSGNPINLSSKELIFYVTTNNCYLYGENSFSAGDSQGNIIHRIGSGTTVTGSPHVFHQNLFFGSTSGTTSLGDNCNASINEIRLVQVVYPEQNITATMKIGTVPYAQSAKTLSGKSAADFLQLSTIPTCAVSEALRFNGVSLSCVSVSSANSLITSAAIVSVLGYTPFDKTAAASLTTRANNLSDLDSSATARVNLGLGSLAIKSFVNLTSDVSGVLPMIYGGSKWTATVSGIYTVSNTAIGSSNIPVSSKLYVEAFSGNSTASFKNNATNGFGVKIEVAGSDGNQYAFNVTTGLGSALMVLNDSKVGIGTMLPSARLHLSSGTTSMPPLKLTSGALQTPATSGAIEYDGSKMYITDGTNTRRTFVTGISNTSIDNISTINSAGNFKLNSSGTVFVSGNLVVGTSAAVASFNVISNTGGSELARFDGGESGYYNRFTANGDYRAMEGVLSGDKTLFVNEIANGFGIRAESALQLGIGTSAVVTIASNKNVGIGTNTPTSALTVSGSIRTINGGYYEFADGTSQTTAVGDWERKESGTCASSSCTAVCSAGKKVIGGGCESTTATATAIIKSYPPVGSGSWTCEWSSASPPPGAKAYALCMRIGP